MPSWSRSRTGSSLPGRSLTTLAKLVENGCFIDVKGQFDMPALQQAGLTVWRL